MRSINIEEINNTYVIHVHADGYDREYPELTREAADARAERLAFLMCIKYPSDQPQKPKTQPKHAKKSRTQILIKTPPPFVPLASPPLPQIKPPSVKAKPQKAISKPPSDHKILTMRKNKIAYTDQQTIALTQIAEFIDNRKRDYILAGYAGTGKTTIAENILNYADDRGKTCIVAAPTNQAVKVLREKLGSADTIFRTLHSVLYGAPDEETGEWIPNVEFRNDHFLLVDESSMISREVYDDLMTSLNRAGAKAVFFGDNFQLEPVGDDPELLLRPDYELTEVKRQGNDSNILLLATCLRNIKKTVMPSESQKDVKIMDAKTAENAYLASVKKNEDSIFILGTNINRLALNKRARQAKFGEKVADEPRKGDKILFISNGNHFVNGDKLTLGKLKVLDSITVPLQGKNNKDIRFAATYLIQDSGRVIILIPYIDKSSVYHGQFIDPYKYFPGLCEKNKKTKKYELSKNVSIATFGYAITAHKSQGSQWPKVYVHQDAFKDNPRWLYTAITRAANELIITDQPSHTKLDWNQIKEYTGV